MKNITLLAVILTVANLQAVTPQQQWGNAPTPPTWVLQNNDASKLPDKDKVKLNAMLNYIQGVEDYASGRKPFNQQDYQSYQNTVGELKEQIDRIERSLSGILSSLTWQQRLEALDSSLDYIANRALAVEQRYPGLRSTFHAQGIREISELKNLIDTKRRP